VKPTALLSEHFTLAELACHCPRHPWAPGDRSMLPPGGFARLQELAAFLEQVRRLVGNRPVHVFSGYRCPEHNAEVGGAGGSMHLQGVAADIGVKEVKPAEVRRVLVQSWGAGELIHGMGYGAGYTHVDYGGRIARWKYDARGRSEPF
jgi:hypothetical protein